MCTTERSRPGSSFTDIKDEFIAKTQVIAYGDPIFVNEKNGERALWKYSYFVQRQILTVKQGRTEHVPIKTRCKDNYGWDIIFCFSHSRTVRPYPTCVSSAYIVSMETAPYKLQILLT